MPGRACTGWMATTGRQVAVLQEDGFEGLKKFLPRPSRRAMVLCDPSYEIKSDYPRWPRWWATRSSALPPARMLCGTRSFRRPEAHDLPAAKLKTLANKAGKSWLNATLTVKSSKITTDAGCGATKRPGLPASGMFVVNPPYTPEGSHGAGLAPNGRTLGARPQRQLRAGKRGTGCPSTTARRWCARSASTRIPRSSACCPRATGSPRAHAQAQGHPAGQGAGRRRPRPVPVRAAETLGTSRDQMLDALHSGKAKYSSSSTTPR
jgi:hypothetical protein